MGLIEDKIRAKEHKELYDEIKLLVNAVKSVSIPDVKETNELIKMCTQAISKLNLKIEPPQVTVSTDISSINKSHDDIINQNKELINQNKELINQVENLNEGIQILISVINDKPISLIPKRNQLNSLMDRVDIIYKSGTVKTYNA